MAREAEIERYVVHYAAERFGVYSTKMGTEYSTGWPDRLFFIPGGKPLMIEFKQPGGKVTEKQKYMHAKLKKSGYVVEVHDDVTEALRSIERSIKKK